MNERMKVLAEQANTYSLSNVNRDSEFFHTIAMAKFAELIVRECAETLRLVPYNSNREFGDEAIYQEAIIKHFGVEE